MQEYVVGFLFDNERTEVALIRKNRPKWQAGKFNGVGGHVEAGEHPDDAMCREFREETGQHVHTWEKFLTLRYPEAVVHFYRAFDDAIHRVETKTDELVAQISLSWFSHSGSWSPNGIVAFPRLNVIPNLLWIIPMALTMETDPATAFDVSAVA